MNTDYLQIGFETKTTDNTPRYGMTVDGYTKRSGAPTQYMIKLEGEKIWRRVMCWQFSNAGTLFVRINKVPFIINDLDISK